MALENIPPTEIETSGGSKTNVDAKKIFLIIGAVFVIIIFSLINKFSGKPVSHQVDSTNNSGVIDHQKYYEQTGKSSIDDIFSVPADTSEYKPSGDKKKELINLDIKSRGSVGNYHDNVELRAKRIQDFKTKQEESVAALEAKLPKKKDW